MQMTYTSVEAAVRDAVITFNSLFEMLSVLERGRYRYLVVLSILYLRCHRHLFVVVTPAWWCFQFSI